MTGKVGRKILICLVVLIFTFNLISCSKFFFYPDKAYYYNPLMAKLDKKDIFFKSKDETPLHGWYVFSPAKTPKGLVVFLHGNAENISTYINSIYWLVKAGYDVFMFDYRGYGISKGKPNFKGIHLDCLSAVKEAYNIGRVKKLIVFGQSLGAAVAVYCAANTEYKRYIKAIILDSPFADYKLIVKDRLKDMFLLYPLSFIAPAFIDNTYSPLKWIKGIKPVPIIFIHGKKDKIIPYQHTVLLAKEVDWEKYIFITDAYHIASLTSEKLIKDILKILDKIPNDS